VVVRRENSEYGENGKRHRGLEWFRLQRVKPYVQYAVGLCVNGGVPSNGALSRLIWPTARASIRGRWTLIGVGYKLGRSSSVITGRIPRSANLLAAPRRDLGEKLAPQARHVFWDLDEVT
jgi:hypothetical protein